MLIRHFTIASITKIVKKTLSVYKIDSTHIFPFAHLDSILIIFTEIRFSQMTLNLLLNKVVR